MRHEEKAGSLRVKVAEFLKTIGIPGLAKLLPEGVEARGNSRNPQKLRLNWPKAWVKVCNGNPFEPRPSKYSSD